MTQGTHVRKYIQGAVKAIDRQKRQIRFIASRQEVDRDGEVIVTAGIRTGNFQKNPIMLIDHDRSYVFGRVEALGIEQVNGADALVGLASALPAGVSAAADQRYQEILAGAVNAFSIGFLPEVIDREPILPQQAGRTYRQVDLLEVSTVTLPSCPSATVLEKGGAHSGNTVVVGSDAEVGQAVKEIREELVKVMRAHVGGQRMNDFIRRAVQRGIDRARGRIDDEEFVFEIADPPQGRTHPSGGTLEVDATPEQINHMLAEVAREPRRDMDGTVERAVTATINRLRGRID